MPGDRTFSAASKRKRNRRERILSTNLKEKELLEGDLGKVFGHYLVSSFSAAFLIAVNFLIDTICVGQKIGEIGIAALNVSVPVTGLLYALGYMFAYGSSNLFSHEIGAGRKKEARVYYGTALKTLTGISVIILLAGTWFAEPITWALCNGASFYKESSRYLFYVFAFAPFYCLETFFNVYMRNDGKPAWSAIATLVSTSVNIVLDFLFVWVFPFGLAGASAATGIGLVCGFLIEFLQTFRRDSALNVNHCGYSPALLKSIVMTGFSSFIREFSRSFLVLIINIVLLNLSGETAVAVYGVIANLGNVVVCALSGVSNAIQPVIAVNLGAKKYDRIHRLFRMGVLTSAACAAAYAAFAEIHPEMLISIFLDHPTEELAEMCIPGIRIISPGYIAAGITTVCNVYMESTLRPRSAARSALVQGFISPIASVLMLVPFLGTEGVWLAFLIAELVSLASAVHAEKTSRIAILPD